MTLETQTLMGGKRLIKGESSQQADKISGKGKPTEEEGGRINGWKRGADQKTKWASEWASICCSADRQRRLRGAPRRLDASHLMCVYRRGPPTVGN